MSNGTASTHTMIDDHIAPLVAQLHAASWKVAYRGIFADDYLDSAVDAERLLHWQQRVPELAAGKGEIFLARLESKPVGFVCIEIGTEREWGAYVDNLHVLPDLRGQRLGALLLARAARWAKAHGETQMYLWVFEANAQARHFYGREGWRATERRIQGIPGGGERPMWRMVKAI
jgi:GNAT superfamily N-acetyltransferase